MWVGKTESSSFSDGCFPGFPFVTLLRWLIGLVVSGGRKYGSRMIFFRSAAISISSPRMLSNLTFHLSSLFSTWKIKYLGERCPEPDLNYDGWLSVRPPIVMGLTSSSNPLVKHRCFEMLSQYFWWRNIYVLQTKVLCFSGSYLTLDSHIHLFTISSFTQVPWKIKRLYAWQVKAIV